jgi:zinc/manganese transport system substrate-binding protein
MITRRHILSGTAAAVATSVVGPALGQETIKVVATFSIIADLVRNVGGGRLDIASLVGPNGDAHVYMPSPADAKMLAAAKAVVVNGLGFEGWIERLVKASGTKAPIILASQGVKPRRQDSGHDHDHGDVDPHAWQSVANAMIYVANIRDALASVDPSAKADYQANAAAYLARLEALDKEVRAELARIPSDRRRIITTHDAFGYFGAAYGVALIAPSGVTTDSEPSARDVAGIIGQIRKQKIPAVFLENVTDPRLLERISRESGAKIGGTLYSDALTDPKGEAPTYIDMMRHNVRQLAAALVVG